ncbi:Ubiquitin conjugating enzyme (UbcF) [Penicillium capsulatum]|uniref:Ubiquitin conjugating enzyme (UbcF) n=1 Tax=Penicillium capsulatum TaxID=69766 RepID=A0A9W9LMU6_9EURO|nr:Ubiquitin conjugating enzyme (UbcF) [Penicillium capsulatum]
MTSTRRLLKESTDLHKNPSPYFTAAPISDENLHDWHFTLAGPPSPTPYATGLYHGRITFPPTYPLRPPSFRFLTPSGRFEVNREICLSISGHHEETWQPAWGVRTALLAIRSEIMGAESKGQVGGMEVGDGLRREYARLSRAWMCRECGTSNDAIMKELWGECTARGVEVDVEGFEGEPGTDDQQREETGTAEKSEDARGEAIPSSTPTSAPVSAPLPASAPAPAPAPSSHAVGQTVPRSTPAATGIPSATTSSPAATPSSSVWLDRAIIGIVIALVILILRRVADVDDL